MKNKKKLKKETSKQKRARLANVISIEEVNLLVSAAGSGIALRDTVTLTVNSDGYCVLQNSCTICGDDDFVGVYANANLPQEDNLGGSKGWQWCSYTSSYTTKVQGAAGIVAIYWSKDYRTGQYVRVCYTPPLPSGDAGTTVHASSI